MLCSVLIPSRARPAYLIGAVASCLGKAAEPNRIEVLIRLDDDDIASQEETEKYLKSIPWAVRILTGPRGRGYADLHLMYNQLAAAATGEWVFQFNDDMRVETSGWDTILANVKIPPAASKDVLLVNPADLYGRPSTIHPFVKTAGIRALGHFSLNAYCDAWVEQVYIAAGAAFDCLDIKVRHFRDILDDEVTKSQRECNSWAEFGSEENQRLRAADVEVLRGLLAK